MLTWSRKMFPGTNLQDLNLDWILRKISALRGGSTGQYLYKKSDNDFDFGWKTGSGGGGGTSDYLELDNKPSINNVELSGNKTAADLGLAAASDIPAVPVQSVNGKTGAVELTAADLGAYVKPVPGIPKTDLASDVQTSLNKANTALQAVPASYRTASAQDVIDAEQDADIETRVKADEIAIVITGARPSIAVTAGQYVIVRNSTISGITDGLYTANTALSPSTDVTAANLMAVSNGGLNSLGAYVNENFTPYHQIMVTGYSTYKMTLPSLSGHFVFIVGSSLSRSAILYIVVQNSGAVAVEEIQKGTSFTYTVGTNELTFGNGATYAIYINEIPVRGDSISVEPIS